MSEEDWLTGDDPLRMWDTISRDLSRRKCLLYIAECLSIVIHNHKWNVPNHYLDCVLGWADGADNLQEVRDVWGKQGHFTEEPIGWFANLMYISARVGDEALPTESTAALFRELFCNPFRPVVFDPRWQSETVLALATGIYAERAFDRMPILADALEDAGCDNAYVLTHCRGPGPHVRGCWVVDLLLGKG
jgi:hypothetical protein